MARPTVTAAFRKAVFDFRGRTLAIFVNVFILSDPVGLFRRR